ncbi:phosphoglycolate phosphatase [Colwellia chukchiensis]|uniref:Phosphoglycolate phosphatase n=1 Tax=Colwellia chukchiensis TaxID=641665 RepID=A0A1H7S7L0_9GAMM|nr:phosphoglycolate phosphatase [Colwellia chukchiensis]SEL68358.1 phosphoglycolate phosphatase [Colwellia chukchiensis]
MKPKNKTLLLFDLDGTLVDSAPDLAAALNQMLVALGFKSFAEKLVRTWVGNGAQTLVERALHHAISNQVQETEQANDIAVNTALAIFLQNYQQNLCVNSVLYPGVKATLLALKKHGYRLAIVTNKPIAFVEPILIGLGLNDLFELLLGGDSLAERKPHPLPLLHCCDQLNNKVEHCIMIGDSKNDILAARAANMASIGVSYGYNYGEDIRDYQPDWCLDTFSELVPLLIESDNFC